MKKPLTSIEPKQTPAQLGFSMPAEWETHEATWLAWPQNPETWPGHRMKIVEDIYLQMLEALLPHEKVHLLVQDARESEKVLNGLKKKNISSVQNLLLHEIPTVDSWIRDYGPTFVTQKGKKAWCKWIFNAWGGKYPTLMEDTHIFEPALQKAASLISDPCFDAGIILEGGSIEVNGKGTCLVTEQCLLNQNRNPQFSREDLNELLKNYLGVSNVLWLHEGIIGDDTDGHIDDIARFVNPTTILATFEDDPTDENYEILKKNWESLQVMRDQDGKKWNLVKLPMPGKVVDGGRLPASYANFYIANKTVLVPVYGHHFDDRAIRIIEELFPGRKIVPILCNAMVYGLGAIHCVSQQEPKIIYSS